MSERAYEHGNLKLGARVVFHGVEGEVVALLGPWPYVRFDGDAMAGPVAPELLTLATLSKPQGEFYEGPLEVGDYVFYKQGWRGSSQVPGVIKKRRDVNKYAQVIFVDRLVIEDGRAVVYKRIFPVSETPGPQIGGEFIVQRGHVVYYRGASHGVVATEITNALNYREILRVEALDGKVLWKSHDIKTGAPPATAS